MIRISAPSFLGTTMRTIVIAIVVCAVFVANIKLVYGKFGKESSPIPEADEPVMGGYDLVEYWNINPEDDGKPGSIEFKYKHTNGYTYYFINDNNRQTFISNPTRYLPAYGGFCAWGIAWEYPDDGWPWASDHMGPPCGPRDGWAILDDRLYCSIWRSYQNDFNIRKEEGITLANQRWIEFYGTLHGGPQNNGCYAWNWQECFDRSIHMSVNTTLTTTTTTSNDQSSVPLVTPLFPNDSAYDNISWSPTQYVMDGSASWKFTLDKITSTEPILIIELTAKDINIGQYIAFGVAPTLMQGPLVACYPLSSKFNNSSTCIALEGNGMGTSEVVNPGHLPLSIIHSSVTNESYYTIRFSSSLYGFVQNPRLQARVLFAKGSVSGNGHPQPHHHNSYNRQAITGIDFLSVVNGYNVETNRPTNDAVPDPIVPFKKLPARKDWIHVDGIMAGTQNVLKGRIMVDWELFSHNEEEILLINIQNVPNIEESTTTYVGFGLAKSTMSGLIITCAVGEGSIEAVVAAVDESSSTKMTRLSNNIDNGDGLPLVPVCKQWRGFGTNLLPLEVDTQADFGGGWHLLSFTSNGTYSNYTIAGYTNSIIQNEQLEEENGNLRAIIAIGKAAADTYNPTQHHANDRDSFRLKGLVIDEIISSSSSSTSGGFSTKSVGLWVYSLAVATVFLCMSYCG